MGTIFTKSYTYILPITILLLWLGITTTWAQDPQFSQYFSAPLYLNPGFTGTAEEHRMGLNYRNQWAALPSAFVTASFGYDYNMSKLNSGFGILATSDRAGSADLTANSLSFLYSYKIQLKEKWVISPGMQFGYSTRNINFNKLVFGDQLEFGDSRAPSSDPQLGQLGNSGFFDFSSGLLVYNNVFWGGITAHHMNTPNTSMLGEESTLPTRYSVHAGARIPLYYGPHNRERVSSVMPSFIYKKQGEFDQLDVGMHFNYNPITIGMWYRGVPIQKNPSGYMSNDAFVFIFGVKFDQFDIGYSYDMTVSELGPATGGSHEIALLYLFEVHKSVKKRRKEKFIPCPTF